MSNQYIAFRFVLVYIQLQITTQLVPSGGWCIVVVVGPNLIFHDQGFHKEKYGFDIPHYIALGGVHLDNLAKPPLSSHITCKFRLS